MALSKRGATADSSHMAGDCGTRRASKSLATMNASGVDGTGRVVGLQLLRHSEVSRLSTGNGERRRVCRSVARVFLTEAKVLSVKFK